MPTDRHERLPLWAQHEIDKLTRERDGARSELERALTAPPSDVCWLRTAGYTDGGPSEVWLPARSTVRFHLLDTSGIYLARRPIEVGIINDHQGAHLCVQGLAAPLSIRPQAANTIQVRVEK